MKKTKKSAPVDLKKIQEGIDDLIKNKDPLLRWLPILNELKTKIIEAKSAGVSFSKILKTLRDSGVKVQKDVLKMFLEEPSKLAKSSGKKSKKSVGKLPKVKAKSVQKSSKEASVV